MAAEAAAAAPYARVMEDMVKGREYATQLQALLRESPEAGRLLDRILNAMSRTIDTARAAAAAEEASEVQSDVTCAGTPAGANACKRKAAAAGGGAGGDKRGAPCRKRSHGSSSVVTKNAKDLEDGHAWRKYGQKEIQNSKHPKAYFRCTHKYDQQCAAQRQVQRRDDDPDVYTVTYIGVHTCRDPATVVVHAAGGVADELHAGSRLISFAANANANANTSATTTSTTTTTAGNTNQQPAVLQPLKLEAAGGEHEQEQEEVLSSLTPMPGPDQGDVTSGLQLHQQFYDGGDHLADMARFGYDYDDTFDLDDIVAFGFDHGHAGY